MADFTGKTVLVTGASGTVGAACVETLLQGGARIMLTDIVAPADPLAQRGDIHFEASDATDCAAVHRVFKAALDRFGTLDAAILAAGVEGPVALVEDIAEAELDRTFAVNLKGTLFWMQPCLRHMKSRRRGSIVAISSISGVVGSASLAAYTLSKHAVVGLVRAAALESGRHGVRVNAVCPGPIESPMMERLDAALRLQDPRRTGGQADAATAIPVQGYVSAAEVAQMAAFLCSDAAASCHGGTYMVDRGFTAR